MSEHLDVLIVGAGLSGIGAAVHLQRESPGTTFALIEARDRLGGTWDLFRYPGIRSDSDMFTLGYDFKPWMDRKAIAAGDTILDYLKETARENGVEKLVRFKTRLKRASWSGQNARWTIEAERGEGREPVRLTCDFLLMCAGYYSYDAGYTPPIAGMDRFKGRIVHPQKWTDDVAYASKRVVVIGSGATAVTLIPELAKTAAHVTMLQRSPTYIVSRPDEDAIADWLRSRLPARMAYALVRWKNVLRGMYYYRLARNRPEQVKQRLVEFARQQLPAGYDVARHFAPRYKPWDQRVCLAPNGDFYKTIRDGKTTVVTDEIETITEIGLTLRSGAEVPADLIIMATGLNLQQMGGAELVVDGRKVESGKLMAYRGTMFSGVPNFASVSGYTNASWTLKADLASSYVCRLINHMRRNGYDKAVPAEPGTDVERRPWVDFTSGYFQRAAATLPAQGSRRPWRLYQNYALDLITLRFARLDDGVLRFTRKAVATDEAVRHADQADAA